MFLPSGMLTFRQAGYALARELVRRCREESETSQVQADDFLDDCLHDLGRALAAGEVTAKGIVIEGWTESWGDVLEGTEVNVPAYRWRAPGIRDLFLSPGHDGTFPAEAGGGRILPIISRAEVLRLFDAALPDSTPKVRDDPAPSAVPHVSPTPDAIAKAWMDGYARGVKAGGRVAKRDDAIRAAREALGCTTRQAEAAFEALPYPELRNPPRTAEAFSRHGDTEMLEGASEQAGAR